METRVEENNINQIPYMKRLLLMCILFFKLGIVNFGGGYALLPLLSRELVDKKHWTTDTELADYYAVGQCTPGAIAVNVSTFIGFKICGMLGGILATISFVLPAFIIIFIIATVLTNFSDNPFVVNALAGINVVVFILILSAIFKLSKKSIIDIWGLLIAVTVAALSIFVDVIPLYVYVIVAAILGLVINLIKEKRFEAKFRVKNPEESDKTEEAKAETVETVEDKKEEKAEVKAADSNKLTKRDVLLFFLGLLVGAIIGFFGLFTTTFVKNKRYKNGIIIASFFWVIIAICLLVTLITGNSIFFDIYFNFFRIGACAFGGGLATFPFLQELGTTTGWYTQEQLTAMLAISESTPGAMGINMSTYVGYTVSLGAYNNYFLAFVGSIISTLGLISPSIIVILIVSLFLQKFSKNKYVNWIFYGLRAASIGLIIAAAYSVLKVSIFGTDPTTLEHYDIVSAFNATVEYYKVNSGANFFSCIYTYINFLFDYKALALALIFGILVFKFKKHPVFYIALGAICGILLQMGNVSL